MMSLKKEIISVRNKMIIPKKLTIGNTKYIIKQKRIISWKDNDVVGNINYHTRIIKLRKKDHIKAKQDTFFHEIAHGIFKELEFNYPKISKFRMDEKFTQEFGLTLRKTFLNLLESQKK